MSAPTPAQIAMRRRALGISQAQLAELIRTSRVTVNLYENERQPMPERRAKQADAALTILEASYAVAAEAARQAGQP